MESEGGRLMGTYEGDDNCMTCGRFVRCVVLQVYALEKLHLIIDQFWSEAAVSSTLTLIEELSEDEAFPARYNHTE